MVIIMPIEYFGDFSIVVHEDHCDIYSGHRQPRTETQEAIEGIYHISLKGGLLKAIEYIKERWYGEYQSRIDDFGDR